LLFADKEPAAPLKSLQAKPMRVLTAGRYREGRLESRKIRMENPRYLYRGLRSC
jgi:hypothetical protein